MKNAPAGLIALGLILLSASITLGVVNSFPRDDLSSADYQLARSATWIIECPKGTATDPKTGEAQPLYRECGTAVQVAEGVFLTAAHITHTAPEESDYPAFYVNQPGKRLPVGDILHESNDVALVTVPAADCPCVPIGAAPPRVNDEVFTAGYPLLNFRARSTVRNATVTIGLIQEKVSAKEGVEKPIPYPWYFTTVRVSPGNSGGGLFHKQDGELRVVGVASAHPGLPLGFMQGNKYFGLGLFATWDSIMAAVEAVRAPARL